MEAGAESKNTEAFGRPRPSKMTNFRVFPQSASTLRHAEGIRWTRAISGRPTTAIKEGRKSRTLKCYKQLGIEKRDTRKVDCDGQITAKVIADQARSQGGAVDESGGAGMACLRSRVSGQRPGEAAGVEVAGGGRRLEDARELRAEHGVLRRRSYSPAAKPNYRRARGVMSCA